MPTRARPRKTQGVPARSPTHRYVDPLDHVWLTTAARVGLKVVRSDEVYAHAPGDGTLVIGRPATLDPDDCLAQMILHELCHAMVEGPESLRAPDWGLDNTSARDLVREHACLRLQASLADAVGLRDFLGATTDFRRYYDALPADPLAGADDPAVPLARAGRARADAPPFSPHVALALEATGRIVRAAAPFEGASTQGELPPMYRLAPGAPPA